MIKNDILAGPIEFALRKALKQFENSNDPKDELIYALLKRSEIVWRTIKVNYLDTYGMTYEDFLHQCEEKRNIMFLSDEELKSLNKAMEIMKIIKEE